MPSISHTAGTRDSRDRLTPAPSAKLNTRSGGVFRTASMKGRPSPSSLTVWPSERNTSAMAFTVTGESNSSWRSSGAPTGRGPPGLSVQAIPIRTADSSGTDSRGQRQSEILLRATWDGYARRFRKGTSAAVYLGAVGFDLLYNVQAL